MARTHETSTPVLHLLGLRWTSLPRAVCDSLYLCATLFAGPLVHFMYTAQPPAAHASSYTPTVPTRLHSRDSPECNADQGVPADGEGEVAGEGDDCGRSSCRAAGGRETLLHRHTGGPCPGEERGPEGANGATTCRSGAVAGACCQVRSRGDGGMVSRLTTWLAAGPAGDLRKWRNLVAAPLTEEFVFRACIVPLLKLEGMSNTRVVLLTPLFFGAAHLHHVLELVRHQRVPLRSALVAVLFQLAYTTVFGWLAAYLFLRTGHLAAPVAAHVFCNWAGFPPFGDMVSHPRGILLMLTTVAGVAAFAVALPRMTAPGRYQQDLYGGW